MAKIAHLDIVKHDGELYVKETRPAETGDKVVSLIEGVDITKGDIYEVTNDYVCKATKITITDDANEPYILTFEQYYVVSPLKLGTKVKVNGEEYEVSEKEPEDGDLVVIVEEGLADTNVGDVYECTVDSEGVVVFYDNADDKRYADSHHEDNDTLTLIPVTFKVSQAPSIDEQIAECKRKLAELEAEKERMDKQAAEEVKWSAIGRKVGEYRVGDVVLNENDDLCVVEGLCDGNTLVELSTGAILNTDNIALICPAEQRFDK